MFLKLIKSRLALQILLFTIIDMTPQYQLEVPGEVFSNKATRANAKYFYLSFLASNVLESLATRDSPFGYVSLIRLDTDALWADIIKDNSLKQIIDSFWTNNKDLLTSIKKQEFIPNCNFLFSHYFEPVSDVKFGDLFAGGFKLTIEKEASLKKIWKEVRGLNEDMVKEYLDIYFPKTLSKACELFIKSMGVRFDVKFESIGFDLIHYISITIFFEIENKLDRRNIGEHVAKSTNIRAEKFLFLEGGSYSIENFRSDFGKDNPVFELSFSNTTKITMEDQDNDGSKLTWELNAGYSDDEKLPESFLGMLDLKFYSSYLLSASKNSLFYDVFKWGLIRNVVFGDDKTTYNTLDEHFKDIKSFRRSPLLVPDVPSKPNTNHKAFFITLALIFFAGLLVISIVCYKRMFGKKYPTVKEVKRS